MGFADIARTAQRMLNDDRVKDALRGEGAENPSDRVLDGVADAVKKASGGRLSKQVDDARRAGDKKIGDR